MDNKAVVRSSIESVANAENVARIVQFKAEALWAAQEFTVTANLWSRDPVAADSHRSPLSLISFGRL